MVSIWEENHRKYGKLDKVIFGSGGVTDIIHSLGSGKIANPTFIYSTGEDDGIQPLHSDYKSLNQTQCKQLLEDKEQWPCLSAFRTASNSHLYYCPRTQYERTAKLVKVRRKLDFKNGQLVLMAGTLAHSGGGYKQSNLRAHAHIEGSKVNYLKQIRKDHKGRKQVYKIITKKA